MRKPGIIILIVSLAVLMFNSVYSQTFKQFSTESEEFLNQLKDIFSKVNSKDDKDKCDVLFDQFYESWNTGVYNTEKKEEIRNLCNLFLNRRLRAYPDYYNLLSGLNGLMLFDQPEESYLAWIKSVEELVKDKRSTKPITSFLETSNYLINESVLYRSKATEWKADNLDFLFVYDTIPKVIFESLNLTCYANKDSSVIYNTKGVYYPLDSKWIGNKGKINWERAGFNEEEVYAELQNYDIYLGFSKFTADSVAFYNKKYWMRPLLGTLEEKILANVTEENASYPRFTSYVKQIAIESLFQDIDFIGGIEMKGAKLIGSGDREINAKITFLKDKKEFIRITSDNFVIYPDRISSALATASIMFEEDSIYHPGLQMNYVNDKRELSLIRAGDGRVKSPYYDSYHSIDIYSEAIYWEMDKPTIDFEAVRGVSGIGLATFESSNYFSESRYLKLQGIDLRNPLNIIKDYTEKYNVRDIHVQGLAEYMRMPQEQVIAMLVNLSNKGFVIYDRDTQFARIKEKLYDYINAVNKKIDYDVIQFNSETYRAQNASLELDSFGLKLFGVPIVILSDSQNVFIYPDNQQLMLKKGTNFAFSGKIHAGAFDFYARKSEFNYDQFKLEMPVIDSLSLVVSSFETDEFGKRHSVRVKNVISDLGGELYIDEPNNKSGLKNFPNYPIFTSTKDAYVYYDNPSIFHGVYNREKFFFYVYPFTVDSLDNFKTELLEFNGYLASANIFPDFEDTLKVQRDYSLGLRSVTPPSGYPAYGGKGTYFNDIALGNQGLRGKGSLQYLTSTAWSDDFIFFPDSCNTIARNFVITEQLTPIEYPAVKGLDVKLHWVPYQDEMIVKRTELPINMFNNQSELDGTLVLTPEALKGAGTMSFQDAEMKSKLYTFKQHEIFADSADFNLKSTEFAQSAFSTKNYYSHIDFNERKGQFVSNGGASFVEFPVNQYICLIDEFNWYMDSYEIAIGSMEKEAEMAQYNDLTIRELIDVPLEGSEFISIHPDQDSLSFISTIASYSLKDYTLYAEDVKYIRVADAAIFPTDRKITIGRNAKMSTIADANILANTVTRYHEIYDAVVNIKSKREYIGIGNYDYVDEKDFRQKIFLKDLGVDLTHQTVGKGSVSDSTGFTISNDFDFAGNITLNANNQFLSFDGGFRIRHTCNPGRRNWIKFKSDINPKDIYINVAENLTSLGNENIEASIMFSNETNRFYSGFLNERRNSSDQKILSAHGFIRFDKITEEYKIGSMEKLKGLNMAGNQLTLGRKQCILTGEGTMNLGADLGRVSAQAYGKITHYVIPDSTQFDLVLSVDFPFDDNALDLLFENMTGKNLQGVNLTSPVFLKALSDMLGEEEAEKIVADVRLFGKFRRYPDELHHTILFSDVKFKWNYATRSYISEGPIGIGSIGKNQVNKYVEGYIEIERKRTGDVLSIYLEFENSRNWYFFNYRNNLMQTISSNTEYNNVVRELKDDKRTVKEDKEGDEYRYIISNLRKKTDFLRKVQQ
ncbi:MAG: hypothetical protein JW731_05355 [Bacteroidales bacterium]|nr:hypothetical protein [Bacteroidales bacterium]